MFKISKTYKTVLIAIFLQLFLSNYFSQTNVDSLLQITRSNANDTIKLTAYNSIIIYYWKTDLNKALNFSKINLAFALKKKKDKYIATAYNNLSGTYYFMGDYKKAIHFK